MILPGETFGVLGSGPVGRMLAQAAEMLGYRAPVFPLDPVPSADGLAALRAFARDCAVVTVESENIPSDVLRVLAETARLCPSADVLEICRSRQHQKHWLDRHKFPRAAWAEALDGEVAAAVARVGRPSVVKTADFSSGGEGQMKVATDSDLAEAEAIFRGRRCVVERWIDFAAELSVIVARSRSGEMKVFPVAENIHTRCVLDFSIVPARVGAAVVAEAQHLARDLAAKLGLTGLLAVEMFLTDRGELLINEFAPRPHPSGFWSLDGGETGQFEQHVRAVCGLPLGPSGLREPTVMVNILGDAWRDGRDPDWAAILRQPRAKLRLYGRPDPRPGREAGHFTVRAGDADSALEAARGLKAALLRRNFS